MTEKKGPLWFKIDMNPVTGLLHGEGNVDGMELLALLEMEKYAVLRQMAAGDAKTGGAETILRVPPFLPRQADRPA